MARNNAVAAQQPGDLAKAEDMLAAARRAYNAIVAEYNNSVESFPAILIAGLLGFVECDFWELEQSERSTVLAGPQVSFG